MYIREIEIDSFKSFADKVTIPFLDGFTTISGPNGSGKSNIIDSILFALGLSSSRTLRAEKLPDLINNHGKKTEASVKISFTEDGSNNGIVVTRRIRKNSSGYIGSYYLNDKASTLTEIHDILSKHNISPGCYNVMMQGDVTGIINMTPFERRKILDEVAGVADFDRRIEQAKKELETVEERVDKSNLILNEINIRLVQLEEERAQALKYQSLKDEKQKFESQLSIVKYFDIKNSMERLHENILDANKSKKDQQEKFKVLIGELEVLQKRFQEISDLVKTKGEDEQIEIKKQIEALKGLIARKKDAINYIDKQISDNKTNSVSSKDNIEKLKEKIDDSNLKIEGKKDQIKIVEENIKKEKEELHRLLSEVSSINQSANEHLEKRNILRRQLETRQDEENVVLKEKITLEDKISRLKRDIEEASSLIERSESIKTEYISNKDLLEVQVSELSKEVKDFEITQKNCLYELDKVKNELSDLNYNITLAYRKVTQLEEKKRAIEETGMGRSIDTVMNSGIAGIHAPLAQLGQVDKEYETALEVAIGGRMRSIVVDNDEVASVAIEILKSSRAGRATFLPLNKIAPMPKGMRLPNVDGIVDFAINLVDFDDIYQSAFYHALGDTIIVEDLNAARKVIGKYRIVTLDGSLIEKSGSMTGGSMERSRLKFAQSEDEELEIYKKRLQELEQKFANLEKSKVDTERKLEKNRSEYSAAMNDLSRKKIELENITRNLNESESLLNSKKELLIQSEPQLIENEKSLVKVNKKLDEISKEKTNIALEIENIEKSLPKDELTKLNDLSDSIEFEIKNHESKLANFLNEIKALEMEIDFNTEAIKIQEERIITLAKDNVTLEQEKELHKKEIVSTEEKLVELDSKIKEISSKLIELQEERDNINKEVLEAEKRKNIFENKLERVQEQIEAYKTRRKELEPELQIIRNELVQSGYEISSLAKPELSVEDINKNVSGLQRKMEALEPVNMRALIEYDEVQNRSEELRTKIDTLSTEKTQIIERMGSYEEMKRKSFMDTYNHVNQNFIEIFENLCDGIGSIVLENPEDPLSGGLTIEAQPRGKKTQRLEAMSGGEKSITALAFVFALQRYMPAPFYAFDEVDMHLDGINVERLSHMIKTHSSNTQFIVVSLRKPMIESANRTIGVTQRDNGKTKVTGVRLNG